MTRPVRRIAYLVALTLFASLATEREARAADPTQHWYSIVTDHFRVHYYRNVRHDLQPVAQRVAHLAERAHAVLAPLLRHQPSWRTHVVVTDNTDSANGFAQVIPLNSMRLFVTAPRSRSVLQDYDDWLFLLIVHEYTHILHLDTIKGLPRIINMILGKTWAPNQIQPRWFIEGIATYHESAQTSAGRMRSTLADMYLRTAVLEGSLLKLDQISSATLYFPRGAVPYLFGGRFLTYVAERFGHDKLTSLSHDYADRPIPYALSRSAKNVVGHSYHKLYDDFREHLRKRYESQQRAVDARGQTAAEHLTDSGETALQPRLSPDGRELAFIEADQHSHAKLVVLDTRTRRRVEQHWLHDGSAVDFSPDRRFLVYDEAVNWRTFFAYHDLFVRNRATGEVRQLTDGLRARHPAVSPDGRTVAFVAQDLGQSSLMLVPFSGGTPSVLLAGQQEDQFFTPRFSPDGRQLVYSRWRRGGFRDIYLTDITSGETTQLTHDRALDVDPSFSADGERIYYSSDRSGIYNTYCFSRAAGTTEQVTNVIGGSFTPVVTPDEQRLYYIGFSAKGYDLHTTPIARASFQTPDGRAYQRPAASPLADVDEEPDYPVARYNPLGTLWPRRWEFTVGTRGPGTLLGIELRGNDIVGRHAWSAISNVNTDDGTISYQLAYTYSRFWPSFTLATNRFEGERGGLSVDGVRQTYREESFGGSATMSLPVLRVPDHSVTVSIGYRFNVFRDADENRVFVTPGQLVTRLPTTGTLAGTSLTISYGNVHSYAFSISGEQGRAVRLSLRVDDKVLGSDFSNTSLSWSWTEYVDMPWLRDHVLALRYGGGVAKGGFSRRGVFALGGFPEQDLLNAVINQNHIGGAFLRGYDPAFVFGNQFHLLNVEYRAPLAFIEKGLWLLPVYVNRLHAAAFVDVGHATLETFRFADLRVGVGAELLVDWSIGYTVPMQFRIGYARGLMEEGGNRFHFLLANRF